MGIDGRRLQTPWIFSMIFYGAKQLVPHSEIGVNVAFSSSFFWWNIFNSKMALKTHELRPSPTPPTQPFVFLDPNDVRGSLLAPRVIFGTPKVKVAVNTRGIRGEPKLTRSKQRKLTCLKFEGVWRGLCPSQIFRWNNMSSTCHGDVYVDPVVSGTCYKL